MNWKRFNVLNNILGWVVFAIATVTYLMSISETANLWDCAEFIACDYRLEIGHPPGAPFYMLVYNIATHLAPSASQAALYANATSAVLSALTILFLFWTISFMLRRLIVHHFTRHEAKQNPNLSINLGQTIAILGGSLVGALVYTFSDTFWYSAVEAEVYAFSSLFTAVVVWLMFKWEERSEEEDSNRWLIFIAYLMGLSIGVHLLNLLCLPAMALIYYYKKSNKPNLLGSVKALLSSFALIVVMMYGIVQGVPKVAGQFDFFFVNKLHLSYNSGLYLYLILTLIVLSASVFFAHRSIEKGSLSNGLKALMLCSITLLGIPFISNIIIAVAIIVLLGIYLFTFADRHLSPKFVHTIQMSLFAIAIGFSSYGVILVRAIADTPMNENNPSNPYTLRSYLSREQYGDTPLFYGPTFAARYDRYKQDYKILDGDDIYGKTPKDKGTEQDQYIALSKKNKIEYKKGVCMLFPRLHSKSPHHIQGYNTWLGRNPDDMSKPTFGENLRFFFAYQLNYMYWRYFLWNFAGRQNDLQGDGSLLRGNAITGIPFVDETVLGLPKENAPKSMTENKGHNVYYALPLLLGLLGLFFQITRVSEKDEEDENPNPKAKGSFAPKKESWLKSRLSLGSQSFAILFFLFFMTGIAIVLYLNQKPSEPRERDYAYAGSFYAFAIWIGIGVAGLWRLFNQFIKNNTLASALASLIAILIPIQMLGQNWDDHNRSGRTLARDMGINYLESCEPNAILYCYGDNDTFPLWYIQDVEGVRRDIRTVNLSYLGGDWYIDQMKRKTYEGEPLPLSLKPSFYYKQEAAFLQGSKTPMTVQQAIKVTSAQANAERAYFPTETLYLNVKDTTAIKQNLIASGDTLLAERVLPMIPISLAGKRYIDRGGLTTLDLFAQNDFKRPIYWTITAPRNTFSNLPNYCVQTGMAYQVLPLDLRQIDSVANPLPLRLEQMYDNVMNKFRFGGADKANVYFDENCRNIAAGIRNNTFTRLAEALLAQGDKERAKKVLIKSLESIRPEVVPYDYFSLDMADALYEVGMNEEGDRICKAVGDDAFAMLDWIMTMKKEAFELMVTNRELQNAYKTALEAYAHMQLHKRPVPKVYLAKLKEIENLFK